MKTKLFVIAVMLGCAVTPAQAETQGNVRNSAWWCVAQKGSLVSVFLPFCYMKR
jgi:hypothetical protein